MRTETRQCLDAVWGTALNAKHLIARDGLPVVFAPLGDEEDRSSPSSASQLVDRCGSFFTREEASHAQKTGNDGRLDRGDPA